MFALGGSRGKLKNPRFCLLQVFLAWKGLLLFIALASPGPGYDTSTTLIGFTADETVVEPRRNGFLSLFERRLVRWDAVYFTQIASRGYLWEQEWAFGWGFTNLLRALTDFVHRLHPGTTKVSEALVGILISHICHFCSVLVLYELTLLIRFYQQKQKSSRMALASAMLHVVCPAGIFLSAPYAESPFSLLNFFGIYFYVLKHQDNIKSTQLLSDALMILCGLIWGLATLFRSNGLFSGLILVFDVINNLVEMIRLKSISCIRELIINLLSGVLMACVAAYPQYLAYIEFCTGNDRSSRIWCFSRIPSIYAWVQKEYWGVGFLKYWTLSNFPLFLISAPTLLLLMGSAIWSFSYRYPRPQSSKAQLHKLHFEHSDFSLKTNRANAMLRKISLVQFVLASLALTNYHVQIITRLASGYPLWYWWLAWLILENPVFKLAHMKFKLTGAIIQWMVIYGMVQAGLYATFLPPA